jgi:hypothetical protein
MELWKFVMEMQEDEMMKHWGKFANIWLWNMM